MSLDREILIHAGLNVLVLAVVFAQPHYGVPEQNLMNDNSTRLTNPGRSVLERSFAIQSFPNKSAVKELALQTGLSETQVVHWFRNQRYRERRKEKRAQMLTTIGINQISVLEAAFAKQRYLNKTTKVQLSQRTGKDEQRLVTWFNNKRKIIKRRKTTTGRESSNRLEVNTHQQSVLEAAFTKSYHLNKTTLMQVAKQTGLNEKIILNWLKKNRKGTKRKLNKGTRTINGTIRLPKPVRRLGKNQTSVLERSFNVHCYPNKTIIKNLSMQTGLHKSQVYTWFGHKRANAKLGKYIHVGRSLTPLRKSPRLSMHQKSVLESSFNVQGYPNKTTLKELRLQTGLNNRQLSNWLNRKRRIARFGGGTFSPVVKLVQLSRPNASQKAVLNKAFVNNCYPDRTTIKLLAEETGLSERKVHMWFKRNRNTLRRRTKEGSLPICSVSSRRERFSDSYRFSDDEKIMLEAVFSHNRYPTHAAMQDIADKLAVRKVKVYNWFVHRRQKFQLEATRSGSLQRGAIPGLTQGPKLIKIQRSVLERHFLLQKYPNLTTLKELALETGLDAKRVNDWFRHKRYTTKVEKGSRSLQRETVIKTRKRKRQESNERQYTHSEQLYPNHSQDIEPQSDSSKELEQDLNESDASNVHTYSCKRAKRNEDNKNR